MRTYRRKSQDNAETRRAHRVAEAVVPFWEFCTGRVERFLGLLNNFLMCRALKSPKVVGLGGMGLCAHALHFVPFFKSA
jgi:hypothetical protein